MTIQDKYLIRESESLLSALKRLNEFGSSDSLTLFVINDKSQIVGTLTDGDIRRQLVNNCPLDSPLNKIMHTNFRSLQSEKLDIKQLHQYKEEGITLIPILNKDQQITDIINLKLYRSYLPIDAVLMAGGKGRKITTFNRKNSQTIIEGWKQSNHRL